MSQFQLLKTQRFLPLFITQFMGAFNDNFLKNALVILIVFRGVAVLGIPPAQMVAAAGGIFILPFFLFSATSGQLADKYSKERMIRWIKLAEIGIMVLAAIGFLTHTPAFLLLVLFLMGLHSTFFGPIKYSILPQHLSPEELVGGNALIEAGTFLAILLGTIVGGMMIENPQLGPLWVSGGLLFVAVIGYWACRFIPVAAAVAPSLKVQWNPWPPTVEILKFSKKSRPVFLSILGISWFWFFGAAILSLFPTYGKEVLKAPPELVTAFLATFSIGIALGSLLCERFSQRRLELGLVPLGAIGISLFTADLSFVDLSGLPTLNAQGILEMNKFIQNPTGLHILADLLLLSVFSGFYIVPLYTMMQERSEASHRSRVIAANNIVNSLFMVAASILLFALIAAGLSVSGVFLVLAVLNLVVALYIFSVLPEFLTRLVLWFVGNLVYRIRCSGYEHLPKSGPAILVCNHVSFIDWLLISAAIPKPLRFILPPGYARQFPWKYFVRMFKVLELSSALPGEVERVFDQATDELKNGEWFCFFPEGTITADGTLQAFRFGMERWALRQKVPLVPMALQGVWGSVFSKKEGRRFHPWLRIALKIGKPKLANQYTTASLEKEVSDLSGF